MSAGIAVALLLAAQAISPGLYLSHQIEVGAALELSANGQFRYSLDYGAVSETAEGKWRQDGDRVRLTSEPLPDLPRFVIVRDEPAPDGHLIITIDEPGLAGWGAPLRVEVTFADGTTEQLVTSEDGEVALNGRRPLAVKPLVPIYEGSTEPVKLTAASGHRLLFRFEPRDLGKVRFIDEPLAIDGDALMLRRWDTVIRFSREGQRPR